MLIASKQRRHLVASGCFLVSLMLGANVLAAAEYYLGSDAASQPGIAVPNLAALNQRNLEPGDRVWLQGGETFTGTIEIGPEDAGTPDQPVLLSSFGSGRAMINAGTGPGIVIYNAGGITVRGLDVVGAGKEFNDSAGIDAGVELPDDSKRVGLRLEQMRISGFRYGVEIWAWPSTATRAWPGFRDVVLSGLEVFDNLSEGVRIWGTWYEGGDGTRFSHANVRISDCIVHHNQGDPQSTVHTGSGIVVSGVNGAVIERCVAHDNGGLGPTTGGGPYGIWVFEANACVLQHNLVYNQRTSSNSDGGAYDLDGGTSNSVVQYNYSYHNDGPAVGVIQFENAAPLVRNTVRFNISENDCRGNAQGVLYVGQYSSTRGIDGADFYHNTVFVSANSRGQRPPAVHVEDQSLLNNVRLRNNLFVATHAGALVSGALTKPTTALYQGNDYWGGSFDLSAFRSGGQETVSGQPTGFRVDPRLQQPGGGGAITSPSQFGAVSAYGLQNGSPIAAAGLDLRARFGLDPGTQDFFGRALASDVRPIGAAAASNGSAAVRLTNLSIRTAAGQDARTLIVGFVVRGSGNQTTLVRGIGPGLASLGLTTGFLPDPRLTLFGPQAVLAANDNWGGTAELVQRFAAVGAFPLTTGSNDAALSVPLGDGTYTAHLTAPSASPGLAMIELYDVSKAAGIRLVNASARTHVGAGDAVLIAGFVLEGTGEKRLLLRGAGPSLVSLGVDAGSVLGNPQLTLYRGSAAIASNDDWGGTVALKTAFSAAGAFAFESDGNRDAALVVSLPAGVYTAHVAGAGGTTGVSLVEVYELP